MSQIFGMIKLGVKLRPVSDENRPPKMDRVDTPSDSHLRLLQESLSRINHLTRERSPESDSSDDEAFD